MRRLRLFLFLLPVVLNNYGCGLENIVYLSPPGNPTLASPINKTFTINSTSKNNEAEFLGFELYYKFYNISSSFPPSVEDVDDLKSYGYLPVCSEADSASGKYVNHSRPLFEVPPLQRGTTFAITINFPNPTVAQSDQPILVYNGGQLSWTIRRDIGDEDGTSITYQKGKPFIGIPASFPAYNSSDTDISSVYGASASYSYNVYLVIFAMSYGRADITTHLYSPPVYLGYIQILINQ